MQLTLGAVGAQQRGDVLLLRPLLARWRARRVRHRVEGDELARQRHQPITAGGTASTKLWSRGESCIGEPLWHGWAGCWQGYPVPR